MVSIKYKTDPVITAFKFPDFALAQTTIKATLNTKAMQNVRNT